MKFPTTGSDVFGSVQRDGFGIVRGVLDDATVRSLQESLSGLQPERAGIRNVAAHAKAAGELAESNAARGLVTPLLGASAFLVRSIFFDKTVASNWSVLWHQDLTIAVKERADVAHFGPWSEKDGTPHVQPPAAILESMLTLRFHLDDADATNGALLVLPGTHLLGRMKQAQVDEAVAHREPVLCRVSAGDVVLMRPLLLHASRKATRATRRRVLHFEFAATRLPDPLRWA